MRKLSYILIGMLLILVACTEDDANTEEQKETITTVEVEEVTKGDLTVEKMLYGRTSPIQTTPVMAPMVGEVDSIAVENGDQVKEDDEILTIISSQTGRKLTITASTDGQLVQFQAAEGDIISTEQPVAMIADLSKLTVDLTVTANNLPLFEQASEVKALFSNEEKETTATVDNIGTLPNETGLYPVKLMVDNEDNQWQVGTVAKVSVVENTVKDTWVVPTTALVEEDDQTFVYVINGDIVTKEEVDVLEAQTDRTAIEAALTKGDQVVTSGQLTLSDDAKIRISNGEDNAS
ncbi:Multidrug resistance protein MdtA [Paraliobacillus sp. PM-2]|uniref:efflux RND transporter periplasmic adaptor subunit n=1 Tax=Paraliobacillus sp. PM-2 TaxID=1462524 RepID=UPI00061C3C5B|nr:efflux RND transporter periplasmic adaptor subunit [Paraliobacillus sp. PM-2]CQR46187.1 Multidrug resistance protein MdtA [Paraliobacillus sp. PM-2]